MRQLFRDYTQRLKLDDLKQLLLGHLPKYRRPELQDIATYGLREPKTYPPYVLKVVNASLYIRRALSFALVLRPRRTRSYLRFLWRSMRATHETAPERQALSLLCPSRGRVGHVNTFVTSVYRTAVWPERIELLFYVDSDDPSLAEYQEFFEAARRRFPRFKRCALHVGPSIGVPQSWNVIAEECTGDLLMMANDDQFYADYGWDVLLDTAITGFPDGIACLYFDDGQYLEGTCDFPIITRRWYEILGYFTPAMFQYWETERWIIDIAKRIDRLQAIPGIFIDHLHYQDYKSPFDATYQRHRITRETSFKDHVTFLRSAAEREREAQKLRQAMVSAAQAATTHPTPSRRSEEAHV